MDSFNAASISAAGGNTASEDGSVVLINKTAPAQILSSTPAPGATLNAVGSADLRLLQAVGDMLGVAIAPASFYDKSVGGRGGKRNAREITPCICCGLWRETSILAGLMKMRWRRDIYGMSLVTCI